MNLDGRNRIGEAFQDQRRQFSRVDPIDRPCHGRAAISSRSQPTSIFADSTRNPAGAGSCFDSCFTSTRTFVSAPFLQLRVCRKSPSDAKDPETECRACRVRSRNGENPECRETASILCGQIPLLSNACQRQVLQGDFQTLFYLHLSSFSFLSEFPFTHINRSDDDPRRKPPAFRRVFFRQRECISYYTSLHLLPTPASEHPCAFCIGISLWSIAHSFERKALDSARFLSGLIASDSRRQF